MKFLFATTLIPILISCGKLPNFRQEQATAKAAVVRCWTDQARLPHGSAESKRADQTCSALDEKFVSKYGYHPTDNAKSSQNKDRQSDEALTGELKAGVWQSVHEAVPRRLREHDQIIWDRASVDAASVPAPTGGEHTGPNPTDRGKLGCKHHLLVDQRGLPLVAKISGAHVHDSRLLIPLVESIPAVKGLSGRARTRPRKLHGDRAYASRAHRA